MGMVFKSLPRKLNLGLHHKLGITLLFISALGSPHGPCPLCDTMTLCSRIPRCCLRLHQETRSVPVGPQAQKPRNSVSKERERNFGVKCLLMKQLLLLSLHGMFPLTKISFPHLQSILNILFCYETANSPIYVIKLPEYCFGFFVCLLFLFWSGSRAKTNDTQTGSWEEYLVKRLRTKVCGREASSGIRFAELAPPGSYSSPYLKGQTRKVGCWYAKGPSSTGYRVCVRGEDGEARECVPHLPLLPLSDLLLVPPTGQTQTETEGSEP